MSTAGLTELRKRFNGRLLHPGEDGYETARQIWNGAIDKRPALIARCASADDVISAVRFARNAQLLVAVRGGGHNVAGTAVCDDGLMIDLSPMKGIVVDPVLRVARVEPGVLWGELDREVQAFGLAVPGGIVTHTGVAGLTLGGGIGWLMRKYSLTCDNLLSVDLVMADGRMVRTSETEHPDLFWGIRGGGGNFGIVTSFEFRLHQMGPTVIAGLVLYPADQAHTFLRFYRDFAAATPDDLTTIRHAEYAININAAGTDPTRDDEQERWVRGFWDATRPFSTGVYMNFVGNEGTERVKAAYGPRKYERLAALKNTYDPTNFFQLNQNVKPRA